MNYLLCYPLFITFKEYLFIHPLDCAGLLTYKLLWNDNIQEHLKEIWYNVRDCIFSTQNRNSYQAVVKTSRNLPGRFIKGEDFLEHDIPLLDFEEEFCAIYFNSLTYFFNICHPEVFSTYINIQWYINQTQQNFIMFIIALGQHVSILIESSSVRICILRRAWRWFYKNRNMLP